MMPRIISHNDVEVPYRRRSVRGIRLFISENVMNDMIWHSEDGGDVEVMGLLIGHAYSDEEGRYVTVEKAMTSPLLSDAVSVRFDRESMEDLFEGLDRLKEDEMITGWYHSHPGFGCFLSDMDIKTQTGIFGEGDGFAVVVDPVQKEVSAFEVSGGMSLTVQFIVMDD